MKRIFAALALTALLTLNASAADVSTGWVQGNGGYYSQSDRSGPYAIDSSGGAHLMGSGATSLASGQATVAATATLIAAASPGCRSTTVIQEGTTLVRIGGAGVTLVTGARLDGVVNASVTVDGGPAIYGIVASGTQLVSYLRAC
jgi:hypothetical protein